jgi:signal transduction histidine kinase
VGLALCKKIAELHNGFISARSKIDEGSTFILSLPIRQEEEI